jgi:hypothetical protein
MLVVAGCWSVRLGLAEVVMISAICFGALLVAALRLGSLSSSSADLRVQGEKAVMASENVQPSPEGFTFYRK